MRMFERVTAQPVEVMIGFVAASVMFGLAFGLALIGGQALASHDDPGVVHACVGSSGKPRFVPAGEPPDCKQNETLVDLAGGRLVTDIAQLQADLDALGGQVDDLATENAALQANLTALEAQVPDCLSEDGAADAVFEGCNIRVLSGSGATDGAVNGEGNVIVGYNENEFAFSRDGSHNIVVGMNHGYSSYAGLVAGRSNTISGAHASVSGGENNEASGFASSVSGGAANEAGGSRSSVSAGIRNVASGFVSSVSGGENNEASAAAATVGGGSGLTNDMIGTFIP